ncbi:hypothetical protein [Thomasclavelia cocleata]|uniref:hypothetical protein n=2 Tax=Thomasclavelia cocleata TaxID=69824 RepID=UPI00272CE548|nr:hypothetical protein [Thomasclavelia cocleata]
MTRNLKDNFKSAIIDFSKNVNKLETNINYTIPIIICIYIGDSTYQELSKEMHDTFISSFNLKPIFSEIQYDNSQFVKLKFELKQQIKSIGEQVDLNSSNIYIVFCGLMHDPIYKEINYEECINSIENAINGINNLNIILNKISFYGIFSQDYTDIDYKCAYDFIMKGKKVFKSIYHLEKPFYQNDYSKICRTIASNMILDKFDMNQDSDDYCWKSIVLHELRTVELVLCKLLLQSYEDQISDNEMYDENIDLFNELRGNLDKQLNNLFPYKDSSIVLYLPLKYHTKQKRKKTFKNLLFGENDEEYSFNDALIDASQIEKFVYDTVNNKELSLSDYENFIRQLISALSVIHKDTSLLQNLLFKVIDNTIVTEQELFKQMENYIDDSLSNYLKKMYQIEFNKQLSKKKINFLEKIKKLIKNSQSEDMISECINLNNIIKDLVNQNNLIRNSLVDLIRNDFGGNLLVEETKFEITINTHLNEDIKNIFLDLDINQLKYYLNQEDLFNRALERFISNSLKDAVSLHNIGRVENGVEDLENIQMFLLLNPNNKISNQTRKMINENQNLIIDEGYMYQHNSFQIISIRKYKTHLGISNYKSKG